MADDLCTGCTLPKECICHINTVSVSALSVRDSKTDREMDWKTDMQVTKRPTDRWEDI